VNTAPGTVLKTLHFICNLQTGPISQSVTFHIAKKAFEWQTLLLIGPISKLGRKRSAVNVTPLFPIS
jgi:hypothetical protein